MKFPDIYDNVTIWWRGIAGDCRTALRRLAGSPISTLTVIVTLAAGMGANTSVFSLLDGLLLRDLHVKHPEELVRLELRDRVTDHTVVQFSYPFYEQLRRSQQALSDISGWGGDLVSIRDKGEYLQSYQAQFVTGNALNLLGIRPLFGRILEPFDDTPNGASTGWPVMLGYRFWKTRFDADPGVVGRRVTISGLPAVVIGVMPESFDGVIVGMSPDLYLPFQFMDRLDTTANLHITADPRLPVLMVVGRLLPGMSLARANAALTTNSAQLLEVMFPKAASRTRENDRLQFVSARAGWSPLGAHYFQPLLLAQGIALVILLLCCINIAGLTASRAYMRRRDYAIRIALGASRWKAVRQSIMESLFLSLAGAFLAVVIAFAISGSLSTLLTSPAEIRNLVIRPNDSVFALAGVLAIGSTVCFGTLPALVGLDRRQAGMLRIRITASSPTMKAWRRFVIPGQIALSLLLLVAAGLLSESMIHLRSKHVGFRADGITLTTAQFQQLQEPPRQVETLYRSVIAKIARTPGIISVSASSVTPFVGALPTGRFMAEQTHGGEREDSSTAYYTVAPSYFRTLETPFIIGRDFTSTDETHPVCILNYSAAKYLFPDSTAIDQNVSKISQGNTSSCHVIGIVEDAQYEGINVPIPHTIFFPMSANTFHAGGYSNDLVFLIRAQSSATAATAYRNALAEIGPMVPILTFSTMEEKISASLGSQHLLTLLSTTFAGVALLLDIIGVYGIIAMAVEQRTTEIGIRMAMGATRANIRDLILVETARLAGVGIILGCVGAVVTIRLIRSLLYGISPFDPAVLAGSCCLLAVLAIAAALLPARRAAALDPLTALHEE